MNLFADADGTPIVSPRVLAMLAAVVLVGGAVLAGMILRRRAAARSLPARLRRVCTDLLSGVLIPNAEAGQIQLEYVLLTRTAILILDVKDVAGHVFGSESMQEWTVLSKSGRFTFANPLPALYDRMAAVKRLLPDIPVTGLVGFSARADFSKGQPPNVIMLEQLLGDLGRVARADDDAAAARLQAAWDGLRAQAVKANAS